MAEKVTFLSREPRLDEYWRGIVLFGRNVASYKFALAKTLLELEPDSGQLVKLEQLAPYYAMHLTEHLKKADKQGTSPTSKFIKGCREYNLGELSKDRLTEITLELGFKNVIDAFHVVGSDEISKRFFVDERRGNSGIRITEEFGQLMSGGQGSDLLSEVEGRWRLVETAWQLRVSRRLVSVQYDAGGEALFTADNKNRRTAITGCRDALNGYQKGRCFYCFGAISLNGGEAIFPDVDHFFPHVLKRTGWSSNIDGVWNLVLACKRCNRGHGGKFASIPELKLVERLYRRNEFLIYSHHPLRETLIQQTGSSTQQRIQFLGAVHGDARGMIPNMWTPEECDRPYF